MSYVTLDIKVTLDDPDIPSYHVSASTSGRNRRTELGGFFLSRDLLSSLDASLIALQAKDETRSSSTRKEHAQKIRNLGQQLFRCLINGKVYQLYTEAKDKAATNRSPLRLRLTLVPFNLAILPWELLCDENNNYLCLAQNPEIILIRSIEHARSLRLPRSLNNNAPLNILGMIANPRDQEPLQGDKEKRTIDTALQSLRESHRVQLTWTETGKNEELFKYQYRREGQHIFHFIGHGCFDKDQGSQLIFENDDQRSKYM
ncbi:MAG: CHAT domain-containing protein, partial [Ktedonobacteraceae bacterium]